MMGKEKLSDMINYIKKNYEDPDDAIKVLEQYMEDFIPCYIDSMSTAVFNSSNALRLDVLLDMRLIQLNPKTSVSAIWYDDNDAQGYYTIARKILEDG